MRKLEIFKKSEEISEKGGFREEEDDNKYYRSDNKHEDDNGNHGDNSNYGNDDSKERADDNDIQKRLQKGRIDTQKDAEICEQTNGINSFIYVASLFALSHVEVVRDAL